MGDVWAAVNDDSALLVEVTRGGLVESSHRGALAVVQSDGRLLAAVGNAFAVAYLRSAAKPFQVLPTVASGAFDHFDLTPDQLAIMCASHHGTPEHVAVVQRILDRIGRGVQSLRCGVHWPIDEEASRQLAARGVEPDARHNNCSGKHAGMLTLARFWGCDQQDYTLPDHPVQDAIRHRLAAMAGLPADAIHSAADGCTVPTFALPLAHAALAFARLVAPAASDECQRVVSAMQAYPHLVSGRGALDDALMQAGQGAMVSKGGAEGYQGLGVRTPDGRAVGIALKIADGNPRARGPVIVALLAALGLVDSDTLSRLEGLRRPPVVNRRDQIVGETRPAFALTRCDPPVALLTPDG